MSNSSLHGPLGLFPSEGKPPKRTGPDAPETLALMHVVQSAQLKYAKDAGYTDWGASQVIDAYPIRFIKELCVFTNNPASYYRVGDDPTPIGKLDEALSRFLALAGMDDKLQLLVRGEPVGGWPKAGLFTEDGLDSRSVLMRAFAAGAINSTGFRATGKKAVDPYVQPLDCYKPGLWGGKK